MIPARNIKLPGGKRRELYTGAKPTPRYRLMAAKRFFPTEPLFARTPRPIVVPSYLEMWLNDQYGDCVTAEEAAAIAMYSVMLGLPEIKITDATVKAFCDKYDLLNGANLDQVLDLMASDGFQQDGGYKDGGKLAVDYSNETVLQAALELGPVKLGIDSTALPSGAGNANGWYASGGTPGQFSNEDHAVGLWNYGSSIDLFAALKTPVPSGFPSSGYHLYTWSTVGVVDHAWIMSTVGEAWLRSPTDVSFGPAPLPPVPPTPPVPPPPPPPPPIPPTPPEPPPYANALMLATALPVGSYLVGGAPVPTVDQLRAAVAPWMVADLDANYFNWQAFLAALLAFLKPLLASGRNRGR